MPIRMTVFSFITALALGVYLCRVVAVHTGLRVLELLRLEQGTCGNIDG